jgi:hypothetical protein
LEKHWSIVIYQAFFAFIHLGSVAAEDALYADLAQKAEVAKAVLLSLAILLGDSLVVCLTPSDPNHSTDSCPRLTASG